MEQAAGSKTVIQGTSQGVSAQAVIDAAVASFQRGAYDETERLCRALLSAVPDHPIGLQMLGLAAYRRGQLAEAEASLAKAAEKAPASPEIQANHAAVLRALGRLPEAEAANRRAVELKPDFPEGHHNLGNALRDLGRHGEAEASFRRAVELRPEFYDAWLSLGRLQQLTGKLADSETSFRKVIALRPDYADVHSDLGNSLLGLDRLQEAEAAFREALRLRPNSHEASVNLAALLLRAGRPADAEVFARRALALKPDLHQGFNNLAIALEDQGRLDEASGVFRQVLKLKPDYAGGHSSLLFCLNYRHDISAEAIAEEYRAWDERHARQLLPRPLRHANAPEAGRKLKIGYVSPDFRQHAVALFFEPLLVAHDRSRHEIYLYGEVPNPDATTQRLRGLADHYRSTVGLSDDRMAALIRQDGIDILIDLAGHTAGNRLLVFARKPAPVQFSYLIGHGTTTGLSAMDGFLSDEYMVPPGFEHLFSERIIRIGRSPLVYQPPATMPDVGPLPARQNGHIRFGCFSRTVRINEDVIALWAELLNRVPGSTLVLNSKPFAEKFTRELFEQRFAPHGIGPERLELIYTYPQPNTWAAYNNIDIALDPFPHNAGTTTIEALWMGVPVLSLACRPSVGRFGASILGALGMSDWVAEDPDAYLEIGERWAKDTAALATLRAGLRQRFEASPMRDGPGLARAVETAYHQLWEEWCESREAAGTEPPEAERPLAYSDVVAAFNAGDRIEARRICGALLEQQPNNADALQAMGVLCCEVKDYPAALKWLSRAVAINPNLPEYWSSLGVVARAMKLHGDAENFYRKAIALKPVFAEAYNNLGNALRDQGKLADAEEALRSAVEQRPDFDDALVNLGLVLLARERFEDAEVVLRRVLAQKPERPDIHDALAIMLMRRGRLAEAEEYARTSLRLRPDHPATLGTLGIILEDQARHDEALTVLRRAVTIAPGDLAVSSSLLFCQNYRPKATAEEIFEEYKRWDDRHGKPHLPNPLRHDNKPEPGRKLKIGYVSPDLRQHVVSLFFEPVLAAHDRSQFEIFLYGEVANPDAMTVRFQKLADHWRSTVGKSDDEVAGMIRADGIDVLIDLAGHTAGNRLTMFSRKPAPVQFSYLIGHGTTTGLSAIDGFLADAAMVPEGFDHLFSEKVVRLPRSPLVYMAPPAMPLVAPLPALKKGKKKAVVTFGCFSRTVRMNDEVIEVWSRLLNEIPNARLVLNSKPFTDETTRQLFLDRFGAHGVAPERLDLIFTSPQPRTWDYYGNIDIALDPFPHNAGTTTIEALWMGVPVLSLAGRPSVGRFGASILGALGMEDWVAQNADDYVAIGKKWAEDLPALAELRRNLRSRFEASPMRDGKSLARAIEVAYRDFWQDWCKRQQGVLPAPAQPAQPDHLATAIQAFQTGRLAEASQAAETMLALDPKNVDALHILGLVAYRRRDWQQAADRIGEAVQLQPEMAELRWNRAGALRQLGRLTEAEAECRKAVALKPDSAEARNNLANTLKDMGRLDESEREFREAVRLRPNYPHGWSNLGNTLFAMGRFVDAEESCRKAVELDGRNVDAHNNLGNALLGQERLDEAADEFRAALAINPDYVLSHSNLLFCSNYRADLSAEEVYAEYRRWDERHGKPRLPQPLRHDNDRTPERKLKIGYASPDFRNHAVAMFFEPLLASRDRDAYEVYLYAEVSIPDAVTQRLRDQADHWRITVGRSDDDVAAMIRADGIDILIDLAGHTAGNRLGVFARKPAPVQFSYLIGQGYTTGLSAVDGFFSDDFMVPPGFEHLFSERIVRLGRSPLVYRPPEGMPEVGPLPAQRNGHVTFGSFSRTVRLNEKVVALWSRLLHRIPGSKLVLNSKPFAEAGTRRLFEERFAGHDIGPERLDLIFTSPQPKTWAHYNEIDIALDPFPHNAGTTTIEALWMGVPVLSKADRPSVGRFGASILGALGMSDWVSEDEAEFIAIAERWARDIDGLAALRAGLRPRFEASPMRDGPGLARAIEAGYRQLWREWCHR